jgi:hypothetical protein
MIQSKPLTGQCPRCGATAKHLAYHSCYTLKSGQTVTVIRCKQHKGTFVTGTALPFTTSRRRRRNSSALSSKASKAYARRRWSASRVFIRTPFNAGLNALACKLKLLTRRSSPMSRQRMSNWMSFADAKPPTRGRRT